MRKSTPLLVGLDVHKDSIAVAHAAGGRADPPVFVGCQLYADLTNRSHINGHASPAALHEPASAVQGAAACWAACIPVFLEQPR